MFEQYAKIMAVVAIVYSRGELGAVFSAKSLHAFLNGKSPSLKFSLYMIRKLLKFWREKGWVMRFGNQYHFTNKGAWELVE